MLIIKHPTNVSRHNCAYCFHVFQQQGQLQFEDKWPLMRPTVLKLLHQEPVSRNEWQDLFWYDHTVLNRNIVHLNSLLDCLQIACLLLVIVLVLR